MTVTIEPIPFFESNYAWLMIDEKSKNAVIVDPGDAKPILQFLKERRISLKAILITHFHSDHINGITELKNIFECKVYAPLKEADKIPDIDQTVHEGDIISLEGIGDVQVIETPGHTLGSICYYISDLKLIFTGDTLFSLGCGRLFEGTPAQMFNSLNKIAALPEDINVYCGHEYTVDNGRFALSVFPNYQPLRNRLENVKQLREQRLPTLPVLLSEEKRTNPFLLAKNITEFTDFRRGKDHFV